MKRLFDLLVLAFLVCSCQNKAKPNVAEQAPIPVRVITVTTSDDLSTRTYVGTTEASHKATLYSKYGGTLTELPIHTNQQVNIGTPLATVNSSTVTSAYAMAAATLQQAEDGYQRAKQVYENGSIPEVQWVEIKTQLEKARASAKAAENALEDCLIKAPFDGVVSQIYTYKGMEVAAGEPILQLVDASAIEIKIAIPEQEYSELELGCKAWFDVPALALTDIPATLKSKSVTASVLTHSYDGLLIPDVSIPNLAPGMVVKVRLSKDTRPGIVIPIQAIRLDVNGRYVWAIHNEKATKIPVHVEGFLQDGILISSGLKDGDQVVIAGSEKICSGTPVKIME